MKKNIQQTLFLTIANIGLVFLFSAMYITNVHIVGVLIHTMMYLALVSTIICCTKKVKVSFIIVNFLEWIFGIISVLKIETRGQEFVPWDLGMTSDIGELVSFTQISISLIFKILLQTFLIFAVTIIQIYMFEEYFEVPKKKNKLFIIILTIVIFIIFPMKYKLVKMEYIDSNMKGYANYTRYGGMNNYGALFNFILDIGLRNIEEVDDYSKLEIEKIKNKYDSIQLPKSQEYDNVIFLLVESFVDFEKILGEEFEEDIIPNYHKYAQKYTSGKMNVDVIGGGTSNVEYQILTMHSLEKYPEGVFPYMQYVTEEKDALPKVFKENGYETTAIHTYKEGFYNRDDAFPLIGFDKFISEEDFENPKYYGEYIDDIEIYNKIVEIIEKEEKSFIHAITMTTHTPYYSEPLYDGESILKKSEYGRYADCVNNYLYALKKSDEMLGNLIEYIENSNEKTLLVMYGDHFPLMSTCLSDLGLIKKDEKNISKEKYPNLFEPPYMVVSNSSNIESRGNITPSEMGMYILENVNLKKIPWIYKVFYSYFINKENEKDYDMIQYDELHGERYWKGI